MNKDLSILVVSCDEYSDLWINFFTLYEKNMSCEFNLYFSAQEKKINYLKAIQVFNSIESQWSSRVRSALKIINSNYVCLLLEDYYIVDKVDKNDIFNIMNYIKQYNLNYYRLINYPKIKNNKNNINDYASVIKANTDYGISLQPAIWEKNYLLEIINSGNYNAWKFESIFYKKSLEAKSQLLLKFHYDKRNVLNIRNAVLKGKYDPFVLKELKKKNINIDNTDRKTMSYFRRVMVYLKGSINRLLPIKIKKAIKTLLKKMGFNIISMK